MKLYDTCTGEKREFSPLGTDVKMYVCGITPYAPAHIGHAMSYVTFDVLRRYLEYRGYKVRHVQNFTDIDDKIIERARKEGVGYQELSQRFIDEYLEDMDALNVKRAHVYPRATEELQGIIQMIRALIEKGCAYHAGGDVYFRVDKASGYGRLSHRSLDGMVAGARVEAGVNKEHPMDFALWKGAKPGEPSWESPWGPGRPGWHIECSAMSYKYLGEQLDIHGGGQDLVFPHHENEIAQTEAYTSISPFVSFWVHNGLLQLNEEKMSKSLGNLVTIREALTKYSADALRLFFLNSHYRSPLAYSEELLLAEEKAAERLRLATRDETESGEVARTNPEAYRTRFLAAMDDDVNTSQALAVLFDMARDINREREAKRDTTELRQCLVELSGVLGLTLEGSGRKDLAAAPFIELLVEVRLQLRAARQWALADLIRSSLQEMGVAVEDNAKGSEWRFKGR